MTAPRRALVSGRAGHLRLIDASPRTLPDLTSHRITIAGMGLHWAEAGTGTDEPPIVMLHGLSDCYLSWSHLGRLLADDRRVLMLDLPGHGESDRPDASYALDWYAAMVAQWLEEIGIGEADIIGHSFGGGVAQMLLIACRARVRRLVLIASGGLGKRISGWLRLASLPWVVERFGQPFMQLGTHLTLSEANPKGHAPRCDVDALSRFNAQPGSARAFARSVRDVIDVMGQKRLLYQRMGEIERLPRTLVIWGDRDPVLPVEHGFAFTNVVSEATLEVFEGCGHYPHHERPEEIARSIRQFLNAPTARRDSPERPPRQRPCAKS